MWGRWPVTNCSAWQSMPLWNGPARVMSKTAKRLWFIKKLKCAGVSQADLVYYYQAVIRPVLDACICLPGMAFQYWKPTLDSIQRRACQIISDRTYRDMLDARNCPKNFFNNWLATTTVCVTWYRTCVIHWLLIVSDLRTNSHLFLQGLLRLVICLYATASPTTIDSDSYFIVWLFIVWMSMYCNPALGLPYINKPVVSLETFPGPQVEYLRHFVCSCKFWSTTRHGCKRRTLAAMPTTLPVSRRWLLTTGRYSSRSPLNARVIFRPRWISTGSWMLYAVLHILYFNLKSDGASHSKACPRLQGAATLLALSQKHCLFSGKFHADSSKRFCVILHKLQNVDKNPDSVMKLMPVWLSLVGGLA